MTYCSFVFFAEINLLTVTWDHAVNSKAKLQSALTSEYLMLHKKSKKNRTHFDPPAHVVTESFNLGYIKLVLVPKRLSI